MRISPASTRTGMRRKAWSGISRRSIPSRSVNQPRSETRKRRTGTGTDPQTIHLTWMTKKTGGTPRMGEALQPSSKDCEDSGNFSVGQVIFQPSNPWKLPRRIATG